MLYLRQFNNLESVNLAGNSICREANYKSYMLSHIKYLKYLDYVRVKADDVQAAIEHHQDEVRTKPEDGRFILCVMCLYSTTVLLKHITFL